MKYYLLNLITVCGLAVATSPPLFKAHEWGTFTSVQGSDGETQNGIEKEEEELPSFVKNLDPFLGESLTKGGCKYKCKGVCCDDFEITERQRLNISQKMETPVIYFYSDNPLKVDVRVDFPKGIISQYYPMPTSISPMPGRNLKISEGQILYRGLEILGEHYTKLPEVVSGNVYGPARNTSSNLVRMGRELEKFIFYRGLGDFTTSLKVTSTPKSLVLTERFGSRIPYILAVNIRGGKGAFTELGSLEPQSSRSLDLASFLAEITPKESLDSFEKGVGAQLVQALIASGLYRDEAQAMVDTWRLSYFHTEGLRILYVLPRSETDALLPLKIEPAPQELVRTLVGRIEVLTSLEEAQLLAQAKNTAEGKTDTFRAETFGRFKEPKLRRLIQIAPDLSTQNYLKTLLK